MKTQLLSRTLLALTLIGLFSQCGTRHVTMQAMQPAEITFPPYVKNLLLVDRTKFDKNGLNILEGVVTGELPGQDRAGLQELMSYFTSTIQSSPRFQIKQASETLVGNSLTSAFPAQLSWPQIEQLCSLYSTEAVIAVEIFDTDFIVTEGKRKKKETVETNGTKKEIEVDEFYAKGVANITIGIRLYIPKEKAVIDQQLFSRSNTWEGKGKTATDAAALLISKNEATRYVSQLAGYEYAYKISPLPISIRRDFYSKSRKADQIAAGSRQADMNDWAGAIATWESGINMSGPKQAGQLCYNIAVAYEVLGDLPKAKEYATKAYVQYGNKKARQYGSVLDHRMQQEEKLKMQMKEESPGQQNP